MANLLAINCLFKHPAVLSVVRDNVCIHLMNPSRKFNLLLALFLVFTSSRGSHLNLKLLNALLQNFHNWIFWWIYVQTCDFNLEDLSGAFFFLSRKSLFWFPSTCRVDFQYISLSHCFLNLINTHNVKHKCPITFLFPGDYHITEMRACLMQVSKGPWETH